MPNTDAFVAIRGNIEYFRLLTPIDGEEPARDKAHLRQSGTRPVYKPYATVQVTNARVLPRDSGGTMTKEEQYVYDRLYQHITDDSASPWHFRVLHLEADIANRFFMACPGNPGRTDKIVPEHELADGLDVVLVLRVPVSRKQRKKGVRLDSVILQEPLRYLERP